MSLQYWTSNSQTQGGAGPSRVPFYIQDLGDEPLLSELASLVLEREERIKRRFRPAHVAGAENISDPLTARYYAFNVLEWPEPPAQRLKAQLRDSYLDMMGAMPLLRRERVYVQCWANTVRKGESIRIHNHGGPESYFSGNLPIQVTQPERSFTIYTLEREPAGGPDHFAVDNRPGRLTIFPSWVYHFTEPWPHDEVRITLAFDIVGEATFRRQARYRVARNYILFDDPA